MTDLERELVQGYSDGMDPKSPEPGPNRHPAYVHGFLNGRADIGAGPVRPASLCREKWDYIEAVFSEASA